MPSFKNYFPAKSVVAPLMATAFNILLVFLAYSLNRLEFMLENLDYFRQNISDGSVWGLFWGGVVFDTPGIFYSNALYVLLMLLPLHFKEKRGYYSFCKWVFIIVNAFFLLINIADSVYFNYTLKRTTWGIFSEFGNESFGKIFGVEIIRHWYLVIYFVGLVFGIWKMYVSPAPAIGKKSFIKYYVISILSIIVAALTVIGGIRGGFINHWYLYILAFPFLYIGWRLCRVGNKMYKIWAYISLSVGVVMVCLAPVGGWRHRDIRPIAISNANAYTDRPIETGLVLNTTFSMIRSIGDQAFKDPHYYDDKSLLDSIYSPIHQPKDSIVANKKNIVIIIIESYGREYIGGMNKEILGEGYKGYTPFTDSLLNHSAWWKYSYDNGGKSIDGMPSILASIPKFVKPFISTPQAMNYLRGLPGLLGPEGYSSAFFHGARTGSMGFDGFARSIGFEKYYGREDFDKDKRFGGETEFDGYWSIWDEPFLQYYAQKMTEMKEPFITALFTASNHHPFKVPDKYEGRFPSGTMKIHPTAGYTDYSLRRFFDTASRQPWFSNTIFIITNDHTNMRDHDEYRSDIGTFYGPIIIYDPSGEITPGERDGIAQQIDIMPTMLNYIGYEKPYLAFGKDLFSIPASETWAINYINGIYQYVRYGFILQFDGEKSIAMYSIDDHLMSRNVIKENASTRNKMENEVKAIIQSYMDRMIDDQLTYSPKPHN